MQGSWAYALSWNRVTKRLHDDGYAACAMPNTLRSVAGDAASVRTFVRLLGGTAGFDGFDGVGE